jgi:hypothetical protein
MTPDERQLLTRFLQDLSQARAGQKDQEAASLIAQAVNTNPDAPYLLVQHTVMADQALHAAQARIAELEAQQRNPGQGQSQGSFFGGGTAVPQSPPPQQTSYVPPPQPQASYAPPPQQPYPSQPAYAPPPYEARPGPFASGGGLGSFLRSAGATAAGVAGGEALFAGLSGLFGGGQRGLFGGGYGMGGAPMMGGQPQETIVNNYYDDGGQPADDSGDYDDGGDYGDGGSFDDDSGGY